MTGSHTPEMAAAWTVLIETSASSQLWPRCQLETPEWRGAAPPPALQGDGSRGKGGIPEQSPGNKKTFAFICGVWAGCRKGRSGWAPGCLGGGMDREHSDMVWDCRCHLCYPGGAGGHVEWLECENHCCSWQNSHYC